MSRGSDQELTFEEIQTRVCDQLASLALSIKHEAKKIQILAAKGKIPYDRLLVNIAMAEKAIGRLQKFHDKELELKIKQIESGTYRFRTAEELRAQRDKRKGKSGGIAK